MGVISKDLCLQRRAAGEGFSSIRTDVLKNLTRFTTMEDYLTACEAEVEWLKDYAEKRIAFWRRVLEAKEKNLHAQIAVAQVRVQEVKEDIAAKKEYPTRAGWVPRNLLKKFGHLLPKPKEEE